MIKSCGVFVLNPGGLSIQNLPLITPRLLSPFAPRLLQEASKDYKLLREKVTPLLRLVDAQKTACLVCGVKRLGGEDIAS